MPIRETRDRQEKRRRGAGAARELAEGAIVQGVRLAKIFNRAPGAIVLV
jgi:hypothetical protein